MRLQISEFRLQIEIGGQSATCNQLSAIHASMHIELVAASSSDRPILIGLLDGYLRELALNREIAVGATGSHNYPYLDAYFRESGRHAFLIQRDDEVVGFALIRAPESTGRTWQVAEFYVDARSRRRGVGREAISSIWKRFPGDWELQIHAWNEAAIRFWTACVKAAAETEATITHLNASDGRRLQLNFRCF
jgi:predicted acetyltransferase